MHALSSFANGFRRTWCWLRLPAQGAQSVFCSAVILLTMLDHDLQQQVVNPGELSLSGTDVVNTLVTRISYEIPVLLHSISPVGVASMCRKLEAASFDVTVIPMTNLVHEQFKLWLSDVLELWDIHEEIEWGINIINILFPSTACVCQA